MAFGNATGQGFVNPEEIITNEVIIEGDDGFLLIYSGTPALGTLIGSIAAEPGTDDVGNEYLAGFVSYQPQPTYAYALQVTAAGISFWTAPGSGGPWTVTNSSLTFSDQTETGLEISFGPPDAYDPAFIAASIEAAGILSIDSGLANNADTRTIVLVNSGVNGGSLQVINQGDGNTYDTERLTLYNTSPVPINSTIPITIFSGQVGAGTYRIHGIITGANGASGTLQPQTMRIGGTSVLSAIRLVVRSAQEGSVTSAAALGQIASAGTDPSTVRTPALSEIFTIEFDGIMVVQTAGTLLIQGRNVTSGSDVTWTADAYSFAELMPVTA